MDVVSHANDSKNAAFAAKVSKWTIYNWYSHCKQVCSATESMLPKMKGNADHLIQVDGSNFASKRKHNRGKLCRGEKSAPGELQAMAELEIEVIEVGLVHSRSDEGILGNEISRLIRPSNYGHRNIIPRVVGLYKNKTEFRLFVVANSESATLRSLLRYYCEEGRLLQTDEWKRYARLKEDGFTHKTINHSKWFMNLGNRAIMPRCEVDYESTPSCNTTTAKSP